MPLSIPSGTRSRLASTSEILPLPRQLSHTTSMTRPRPPQVEHACVVTICPRMLSRTVLTDPAPLQVGQTCDSVPPYTVADTTVPDHLNVDFTVSPERGLVKGDLYFDLSVTTTTRALRGGGTEEGAAERAVAEESLEDVLEASERVSPPG